jgi:acid stress-induced BolA-like protein IbaG/YrbA
MALRILSSPTAADDVVKDLSSSIASALPEAKVEVEATSPGHFEIRVVSSAFEGKSRLRQQQLVYGAIAHLMKGDDAPVHAVDRLQTELP